LGTKYEDLPEEEITKSIFDVIPVFDPFGWFHLTWMIVYALFWLFQFLWIPIYVTFDKYMDFEEWKENALANNPEFDTTYIDGQIWFFKTNKKVMWIVLGFFLMHIVLAFNTGYKDRNNDTISNRYKIAKNYLRGGF
jgi:hypothetical protein